MLYTLIGGNIDWIIKEESFRGSFSSLFPNPFMISRGGA
jgi:hypothetical protein